MNEKPKETDPRAGHTRRTFFKRAGAASALVAANQVFAGDPILSAFADDYVTPKGNILLPRSDMMWRPVEDYIDEPGPEYRHASEYAFEAFRDIKYGIRIHWGLYSIEQWSDTSWPYLKLSFEERRRHNELYKTWNPTGFDADEWMSLFAQCGMKMFAFTTKHHEGFSMYDTKTRVRQRADWTAASGPRMESCDVAYSIMETPFSRDVVKELCAAARKRKLKIDLYYSHPDWYDADFRPYVRHPEQVPSAAKLLCPEDYRDTQKAYGGKPVIFPDPSPAEVKRMMERHRAQLTELLTNYGKIDMVCLDMWLGKQVWLQLRETMIELRKIQPDVMFRARGIGDYGDYYTPEHVIPGGKESTDMPWFVIYPLGHGFSYGGPDGQYKGSKWIVQNLVDSVAKGGNFMVGVGPDGNGRFSPTAVQQLREAGQWLRVNGGAIYGTRARPGDLWKEGDIISFEKPNSDDVNPSGSGEGNVPIRFTRSKDEKTLYAICLGWPGTRLRLRTVPAKQISKILILGVSTPLPWRDDGQGVVVDLPSGIQDECKRLSNVAWTFKVECKNV
jgi:alpha-L-fucosidase